MEPYDDQRRRAKASRRRTILLLALAAGVLAVMSGFLPGQGELARRGLSDPWKPSSNGVAGIPLAALDAPPGWHAALVPVGGYPAAERYLEPLRSLTAAVSQAMRGGQAHSEFFIQLDELHKDRGAEMLSRHGVDWIPIQGLGVWPNRAAPTLWSWKDFFFRLRGATSRLQIHHVFRVTAGPGARDSARQEMIGRGVGLEIILSEDAEAYMEKTKAVLLPPIKEETHRAQPYFVPLLDGEALTAADAPTLDSWMADAVGYIRESPEDSGLLVVSRTPLAELLADLEPVQDGDDLRIPLTAL